MAVQPTSATYAKRSCHHIKDEQRFVLSVIAYDSLPGHLASPVGQRRGAAAHSPTGEACPAKPLGEDGRVKLS